MILEYAVGNIAVAIGWSGYFHNLLKFLGLHLAAWLLIDPISAHHWIAGGPNAAAELTNVGTLFAFVLVAGGILVLRRAQPDAERKFRIPGVWIVASGCMVICVYLMTSLPMLTWIRFAGWMAMGMVVYFSYSIRHSELRKPTPSAAPISSEIR